MFLATPEKLAIRNAISERLRNVRFGDLIGKAEVEILCQGHWHLVYGALRDVEKSHGAIFENVRGIGWKRMETNRLPVIGERARQSIGRKARLAVRKLVNGSSRANDIDGPTMHRITQELSVLGILREMTKVGR